MELRASQETHGGISTGYISLVRTTLPFVFAVIFPTSGVNANMDFSLDVVDPALRTRGGYLSWLELDLVEQEQRQIDFDLFGDVEERLCLPDVSPSMVSQTIEEPSQFAEFSPSPTTSPSTLSPSSPVSVSDLSDEYLPPQQRPAKRHSHQQSSTSSIRQVPSHEPYPTTGERVKRRHQTKLACVWCRKLNKKCDAQRPCARCFQFNRCSECVDAAPRKPRAKGVGRGRYTKTRDLVTRDFQEALVRQGAYVTKLQRGWTEVGMGLSRDETQKMSNEDVRRQGQNQDHPREANGGGFRNGDVIDVDALGTDGSAFHPAFAGHSPGGLCSQQGGFPSFIGTSEDLLTGPASSPDIEQFALSSRYSSFLAPVSPTESFFEEVWASSTSGGTLFPESTSSSIASMFDNDLTYEWKAIDMFPNLMKLVHDVQIDALGQHNSNFSREELQMHSEIALTS